VARYHGKAGQVKVGATVVGSVRAWTLQAQPDLDETSSFGDTSKTYVQGLPDIRGTIEVAWDDTESTLSAQINAATPVTLDLFPVATVTAKHATGPAYIGLQNFQVRSTAHVAGTYSFAGAGSWTFAL
jgi:hypothetical protein